MRWSNHFSVLRRSSLSLKRQCFSMIWPYPMLFHHVWLSNCNMLCGNLLKVITVWISTLNRILTHTRTHPWCFGENQIKVSVLRATSTTSWQQVFSSSSARAQCIRICIAFCIHNFWLNLCENRVCVEYEMIYLWLLPIFLLSICLTSIWTPHHYNYQQQQQEIFSLVLFSIC